MVGTFPDGDVPFHFIDEMVHGGEGFFAVGAGDDEAEGARAGWDKAAAVFYVKEGQAKGVDGGASEDLELGLGHAFVELVGQALDELAGFYFADEAFEGDQCAAEEWGGEVGGEEVGGSGEGWEGAIVDADEAGWLSCVDHGFSLRRPCR
jgi:hypothetical protein